MLFQFHPLRVMRNGVVEHDKIKMIHMILDKEIGLVFFKLVRDPKPEL